jgi:DNA-binding MarR family transcriptional regulator
MVTVPCLITVAGGVLAPGHLGELTRYLPFELADDVLVSTKTMQRRMRALPSRAGICFVLAMTLFPGIGYLRVWDKMTAGLDELGLDRPSEKALRDLRRRLGPAPLKALFETVAVPLASPRAPGVAYRGLRTVAFDGLNSVKVPDSDRNRSWLGKKITQLGIAGYPAMRIVVLAETGTRGLLGAVIGGKGERSEVPLARKLVPLLRTGMLLLAGRGYDAGELMKEIAATGAHFLVRGSAARKPAVEEVLPDGSYLSRIDGLRVRIIEAALDVHGADGTRLGDSYRLITTLLDWRRYPAGELIRLYHERREIEVAYLALRHTLLGGYVLRSRDRAGAEQELWALLAVYQALRMAMTAQARMLCTLMEGPRGMAELAGLLGIDKGGVTGLVDRVERRGLAERTAVPGDRRALRVRLTTDGERTAVAVHDLICAELDALTADLVPADRERFRCTIALIVEGRLLCGHATTVCIRQDQPGGESAKAPCTASSGGCRVAGVTAPDNGDRIGPLRVGNGLAQHRGDLGLEQLQTCSELLAAQVPWVAADRDEPVAERLVIAADLVDDLLRAAH